MLFCLGGVTFVCALLLGIVHYVTLEPIKLAKAAKEKAAIASVSPRFARVRKADVENCSITLSARGDTVCYVIKSASDGFGGAVEIITGFLPDGKIYRTEVLSQSETPGLGVKCGEKGFLSQFNSFDTVSGNLTVKKDGGDVDAITAATITSRAYCQALRNAMDIFEEVRPALPEPVDSLATATVMEESDYE